jgi:hypothetical protein
VRTEATVEKVMPSTGDGDDRIRLTFTDARGRRVVATTRVNDAGKYKAGDSVAIVYDRSNPHRVRTIGDAAPTWADNLVIPVVVILILLPVILYGLASSFRLRRLEKRSGSGTPMMLNVVCTSGIDDKSRGRSLTTPTRRPSRCGSRCSSVTNLSRRTRRSR